MNVRLSRVAIGLTLILGTIYGLAGITDIVPGEIGVVFTKLGDEKGTLKTVPQGLSWWDPIKYDVDTYDTKCHQTDEEKAMPSSTKDGQNVVVDASLEICLDPEKVPQLHNNVGKDYYSQVVYPDFRSAVRDDVPRESSDRIYTEEGRKEVSEAINRDLARHSKNGILIKVNLRAIEFTNEAFKHTIEVKATEQQKIQIEDNKAKAAEKTAIATANLAEGNKQARIKKSEGERQAVINAAEAQKEKDRLEGEGQRLRDEARAAGILAVKTAEAEGAKRLAAAYTGPGAEVIAQIKWAENLGPNVKVYGVPTGSPNTNTLIDLNGVLNGAFKGTN